MNLNVYDNVTEKLDKTKTWVDVRKKQILSREIKYRPYYCLCKKLLFGSNITEYYIVMLQSPVEHMKCKRTVLDDYGRIKIRISDIWKNTYLSQLKSDYNIGIDLVESDEEGDSYLLDV